MNNIEQGIVKRAIKGLLAVGMATASVEGAKAAPINELTSPPEGKATTLNIGAYDINKPYTLEVPATATPIEPTLLQPPSPEPIVSPPTPVPGMPGITEYPAKGGPMEPAEPAIPATQTPFPSGANEQTPQQEHKDMLNIRNTPEEPPKSPEKETTNLITPDQIDLQFADIQSEADLNKLKDKSGPVYKEITENPEYKKLLERASTFIKEYTTGKGLNAKDFNFFLAYKFADGHVHIGTGIYQLNAQQFAEAFYFLPEINQPGPTVKVELPAEKVGFWTMTLAWDNQTKKQVAALTDAESTFLGIISLPPEGVTGTPTPTPEPDKPTIEVASYIVTPEAQLQKQGTEKITVEKVNPPSTDIQKTIDAQNKEVEKQPAISKKMGFSSSFLGRNYIESQTQNIQYKPKVENKTDIGNIPEKLYGAYMDRVRYAMWLTYYHADQPAPYGLSPDDFQNNAYRGKNGFSPDGNSQSPVITFEEFVKQAQEGKSFEVWVPDYTKGTRNFEDGREVQWKKVDLGKVDIDIKMDKTWKKGTQPVSVNPAGAPIFYMTEEDSSDGKQILKIVYNPGVRDYGKYKEEDIGLVLSLEDVLNHLINPQALVRSFADQPNDPIKAKSDANYLGQIYKDAYSSTVPDTFSTTDWNVVRLIRFAFGYTTKPVTTVSNENASPLEPASPNLSNARTVFYPVPTSRSQSPKKLTI